MVKLEKKNGNIRPFIDRKLNKKQLAWIKKKKRIMESVIEEQFFSLLQLYFYLGSRILNEIEFRKKFESENRSNRQN